MQVEYHLFFPRFLSELTDNIITFSIGNMKSERISVVYYVLHVYNLQGDEILVNSKPLHIGERWVVDKTYSSYYDTYEIPSAHLSNIHEIQIELVAIGVNDNNPLRFNQVMLTNKEYDEQYHEPDEALSEATIGFTQTRYANLYTNKSENYLQIIKPEGSAITTLKLPKSEMTVIAPHLEHEDEIDNPTNLLMEFFNQYQQETTIHNSGFKM